MHPSTTFIAAAALLGLAAASPLDRRYEECKAPQLWYACWDDYQGCCSTNPCKGPAMGVKSGCPSNDDTTPSESTPASSEAVPSSSTSSATTSIYIPSPAASAIAKLEPDTAWTAKCKEDNSNCNWAARFFSVKTNNETYTTYNTTSQFHVANDIGSAGAHRHSIAVFSDIPSSVTKCSVQWYKPKQGIFYGTWGDGSISISTLDMGGKPFAEAVGSQDISFKNTKSFIDAKTVQGGLDLGNWGRTMAHAFLSDGRTFACKGPEVVVHFALDSKTSEGSVTVDQVSKAGSTEFVQRAGWFLKYE
ncbi:hypothetical protein CC86DRAFT_375766 [Ophiobolus disseminans]|uniref:Concanavalin A-like lectin/glucanase n=1 Tax=Ophiobolus disseminans TaxID=1469910 RepID=A0A6A6ZC42_9PLEO|nr:hypothetical protein CC86DRAFT_375766 [Ophiobolus disseminans]